ncbi:MAG TPA: hypothetical protein VGM67_05080 [Gemmatimonadaceae bacterium]
MSADVTQALTRGEWAGVLANRAQLDAIREQFLDTPFDGHAVAALLLFEQPFGFSAQDVEDETQVAAYCDAMSKEQASQGNEPASKIFRELGERHRIRASKISALLPPIGADPQQQQHDQAGPVG